jgi:hypothetical protein
VTARRHKPSELGALDLALLDPRIAWARTAKASSEWSSSYAASSACGPPSVFPRGGDEHGTWLAGSDDRQPALELTFSAPFAPRALIVCETCGPGGITSIRDLDHRRELYAAKARALQPTRDARLLVVPLDPEAPAPRRIRIELRNVGDDYQEIDAVGLIAEPIEALVASPVRLGPARHRRYRPDEVERLRFRDDHRIVWARRARASSEWSDGYAAKGATGPPNVFPRGGDHERTWLSRNDDRDAWLELTFENDQPVHGLLVAETCGAGATIRALGDDGRVLWQARHDDVPRREARLLHVPLEGEPVLTAVRLYVSPAIDDYREIDAVALLRAPFDELSSPPPPPPIPGAPRGGFTIASGGLVGASPTHPAAHVVVRTRDAVRVVSSAGPLTLVTEGGQEIALTLDDATVYGPPLPRRRGRWRDVAPAMPWLAEALGERAPSPEAAVDVYGRAITRDAPAHVAGIASKRADGGFRDAGGAAQQLTVRALADRPLADTDFPARGTRTFREGVRPLERARAAPHGYDRWVAWLGGVALAGLLAAGGLFGAIEAGLAGAGWPVCLGVLGFGTGLLASSITLDLVLRRAAPLVVERGAKVGRNRRVRLPRPLWNVLATFFSAWLIVAVLALLTLDADAPAAGILAGVSAVVGLHALVRLAFWAWSGGPALLAATRATFGRTKECMLEDDVSVEEVHTERSEHLGTEQVVDDQGRVTTRDRFRSWTERDLRVQGEPSLVMPDGSVAPTRPERLVVPRVEPRPVAGDAAAVMWRVGAGFGMGDPALVLGADGRRPELVVLGDHASLRRAVLVAWAALGGLLLLATGALPLLSLVVGG